MKRLVVLFAILLIANSVNAGIVDLWISSLNGEPINPVKEIFIKPTDIIGVDVGYAIGAEGWSIFSISKEMVITPRGSMTADIGVSVSTPANPGFITWKPGWNPDLSRITIISDPAQGQVGDPLIDTVVNDIGSVTRGIILDHFLLHYDDAFDVLVKLVENPNTGAGESFETDGSDIYPLNEGPGIVIHTPEPMTITLLGLGGLFLARRKK